MFEKCCGCHVEFAKQTGSTHRYMLSAPACWALYGEVLAREYQDQDYFVAHQLTVDAYAAQHPGVDNPQARQSVAVHLTALYAYFEGMLNSSDIIRVRKAMTEQQHFPVLLPPDQYALSVLDVHHAQSAAEHLCAVTDWAHAVWSAWAVSHYQQVKEWFDSVN